MFSEKDFLYCFQCGSVIIKKFPYIAFNLTIYQQMLRSQDFTNLIFSTNLDRFEKRLMTTVLGQYMKVIMMYNFCFVFQMKSTTKNWAASFCFYVSGNVLN